MEALTHRKIKIGKEYEGFFPVANLTDETVKKGASVSDTVKFIPKVVRETLPQTKEIAETLRGNTLSETCNNIWKFVYDHINYHKDEDGIEQIRSPARTWHDRQRGVDCDCYTVFISSILSNLKIPHTLRIAKYRKDYFQHIYPIVRKGNGKYITIDCVVEHFNYEEPYTEIKDTTMDLQYLSGTENTETEFGNWEDQSLGKKKLKDILKQGLHLTNRINPATVLLRNGLLASMKLNIFKIAQRLKYAYMSDADAKKQGTDMAKFGHLKAIKDKLEQIFYGAGGKPENLRKAILTGKGNKNHDVSGLGEMNEATPLPELLGDDIFHSENSQSLGELGEPVTAASITAATGALAAIAGLLKGIGNIFPKKDKSDESSKDFQTTDKDTDPSNVPAELAKNKDEVARMDATARKAGTSTDSASNSSGGADDPAKQGFWDKNKKWLKPTLFGAGGLTALYAGFKIFGSKKEEHAKQLTGTKNKQHQHQKKEPVALM